MRVFAVSDIHVDFPENRQWVLELSGNDFKEDILILAGDVTDVYDLLNEIFATLKKKFKAVYFIPGNHDLWVCRNGIAHSFEALSIIQGIAANHGILMQPSIHGDVHIVPLYGWYDYSFGHPEKVLKDIWMDYNACLWPPGFTPKEVTDVFIKMNEPLPQKEQKTMISFSHFLPRIDLMPSFIPMDKRRIYPVLGTTRLEEQIRQLAPQVHVYGHSHVNTAIRKENRLYINNAFGYPYEKRITRKRLQCVYDA